MTNSARRVFQAASAAATLSSAGGAAVAASVAELGAAAHPSGSGGSYSTLPSGAAGPGGSRS